MTGGLQHDWFPRPLPDNVELGVDSWLYSSYAFLHYSSERGVRIGRSNGVYDGTMFVLGPAGRLVTGDFCTFNGSVVSSDHDVVIGSHAMIGYRVLIADTPFTAPPGAPVGQETHGGGGDVVIGDNVWINNLTVVVGPVTIGDDAVIGTGTVVDQPVPPGAIVAGQPARIVGSVYESEDGAGDA